MALPLPFAAGKKPLVGVVHLQPLPGSPRWSAGGRPALEAILARARADAEAYLEAGFDGLIVENYGDAPFFKTAPAETVALVTRCALEVVRLAGDRPVGVNVLRNDAHAALACALAAGGRFVRVNVHTGLAATDQGMIEGRAAETMRLRALLGLDAQVAVLADVHVKHARPLDTERIDAAARDAVTRGLADGLVVSGLATGSAPLPNELVEVRAVADGVPVWIGSGLTPETCASLVPLADGAIVASAVEGGGRTGSPVDPARARALVEAFRAAE